MEDFNLGNFKSCLFCNSPFKYKNDRIRRWCNANFNYCDSLYYFEKEELFSISFLIASRATELAFGRNYQNVLHKLSNNNNITISTLHLPFSFLPRVISSFKKQELNNFLDKIMVLI